LPFHPLFANPAPANGVVTRSTSVRYTLWYGLAEVGCTAFDRLVATGVTIGRVPLTVAVIAGIPLNIGPAAACAGCALSPAKADCDTLGLNVVSVSDACCPSTDQPRGVTAEPIVAEVEIPPP
jgi:hypothetical protein